MTTSITGVAVARDGMYATDDGGEVWRLVNPPGVRVSNTTVMGASHGEAWVIQPARSLSTLVVWVSPNLGRSWQSSQLPTGLTGMAGRSLFAPFTFSTRSRAGFWSSHRPR